MPIFERPDAALVDAYPGKPARLKHTLAGDPLFSLDALVELAARLPAASVEYNAGDLPIDQDAAKTPSNGLSIEETIRRIRDCRSWMALKNVEQDPRYRDALERCLAEIEAPARAATGPMEKKLGFIFISSPGSVTPFHMDPEHNILMQIMGEKRMYVFPTDGRIVSDEQHELYHTGDAHRNLRHQPEFDPLAEAFDLKPGDALYVPVKAPHWVKNGPAPSVSFSITWRSRWSLNEAELRRANHWVRRMGGRPPAPGAVPWRDNAAVLVHRVAAKLGLRAAPT
jgi:oxalate decarboxylase/phosphoglucose isomerase-like protein (cupin superfamily)